VFRVRRVLIGIRELRIQRKLWKLKYKLIRRASRRLIEVKWNSIEVEVLLQLLPVPTLFTWINLMCHVIMKRL